MSYLYFLHHQFVNLLLQSQNFFLQSQTVGVEDWFPQCPLFLQLRDLFQFGCVLFPQLFRVIPDSFIQNFFVDAVRAAIAFPVPMISPADIFHTAAAVPAADHGTEHVPAFLTGQQSSIAVLRAIIDRRTRLLLQPHLDLLPDRFLNDDRTEILMTKPVRFADSSRFAAEIFSAMIDQHTGLPQEC